MLSEALQRNAKHEARLSNISDYSFGFTARQQPGILRSLRMTVPEIHVRNLQRKTRVDVAELEKFAGNAVLHCLQLQKGKQTDLRKLSKIFVWLISDQRMVLLHRKFLGQ